MRHAFYATYKIQLDDWIGWCLYLQEKRFANAIARVPLLHAHFLGHKINRNHVNNFHRLSSRLSRLVFMTFIYFSTYTHRSCLGGERERERAKETLDSSMRMFCVRSPCILLVHFVRRTWVTSIWKQRERERKIKKRRSTEEETQWLVVVGIVLCNAPMLTKCSAPPYHIWCDHFAARINDFLQLEILIWNCFDAFVGCQVLCSHSTSCKHRNEQNAEKKNTNDVASHKTLNNNLNETSAIDPLIKFCTLHGRNASFSNEPVF